MNWNWMRALANDIGVPEIELIEIRPSQGAVEQASASITPPAKMAGVCTCWNE